MVFEAGVELPGRDGDAALICVVCHARTHLLTWGLAANEGEKESGA